MEPSSEVLEALEHLEKFFTDGGEIADPDEDVKVIRAYLEHTN